MKTNNTTQNIKETMNNNLDTKFNSPLAQVDALVEEAREMKSLFTLEHLDSQEEVRQNIQFCEGRYTQQAIYSTFHDALTQICYVCRKIRTTIYLPPQQ